MENREHILWDRGLGVVGVQEVAHWARRKSRCINSAGDLNYFLVVLFYGRIFD